MNAPRYAPGAYLLVRWGSRGTQLARLMHYTANGTLRIKKLRAASGKWTLPLSIVPAEVLREATAAEVESMLTKGRRVRTRKPRRADASEWTDARLRRTIVRALDPGSFEED